MDWGLSNRLSRIIKDLNEAFGTDFSDDDKVFLGRVKDNMLQNQDLLYKMEHNSRENVKIVFDQYFDKEMHNLLENNMKFYKKLVENDKLKNDLKSAIFDLLYYEFKKIKKQS